MLIAIDERAAFFRDAVSDRQILMLEGTLGVDQEYDDLGKADGAHGIARRKLLRGFGDLRFAPKPRRIEEQDRAGLCSRESLETLSRVRPGSGPVIIRSSPRSALTSVDLPAFGRPTIATRIGFTRSGGTACGSSAGGIARARFLVSAQAFSGRAPP